MCLVGAKLKTKVEHVECAQIPRKTFVLFLSAFNTLLVYALIYLFNSDYSIIIVYNRKFRGTPE